VTPEELDDLVDLWHEGAGGDLPLHEFLGMTWAEYAAWTRDGTMPERGVDG
jgi:hypothetical protein